MDERLDCWWWNQSWGGMTRRDLRLYDLGDGKWRLDKTHGGVEYEAPGSERACRDLLAREMDNGQEWTRLG